MANEVLIAVISFLGTCAGAFSGVLASNKVVELRLKTLEEKVKRYDKDAEEQIVLKGTVKLVEQRMQDFDTRLKKVEVNDG